MSVKTENKITLRIESMANRREILVTNSRKSHMYVATMGGCHVKYLLIAGLVVKSYAYVEKSSCGSNTLHIIDISLCATKQIYNKVSYFLFIPWWPLVFFTRKTNSCKYTIYVIHLLHTIVSFHILC